MDKKYEIVIEKTPQKFINSQEPKIRDRLKKFINNLPNGTDIKPINGFKNTFRLRLGKIRIVYEKYDNILKIIVIDAGYRGDIYK
jgi:mRNA-degrading endonuclease RelE of RelBE toxin-antitoxin system